MTIPAGGTVVYVARYVDSTGQFENDLYSHSFTPDCASDSGSDSNSDSGSDSNSDPITTCSGDVCTETLLMSAGVGTFSYSEWTDQLSGFTY